VWVGLRPDAGQDNICGAAPMIKIGQSEKILPQQGYAIVPAD
jgi:hypothetical protein